MRRFSNTHVCTFFRADVRNVKRSEFCFKYNERDRLDTNTGLVADAGG